MYNCITTVINTEVSFSIFIRDNNNNKEARTRTNVAEFRGRMSILIDLFRRTIHFSQKRTEYVNEA